MKAEGITSSAAPSGLLMWGWQLLAGAMIALSGAFWPGQDALAAAAAALLAAASATLPARYGLGRKAAVLAAAWIASSSLSHLVSWIDPAGGLWTLGWWAVSVLCLHAASYSGLPRGSIWFWAGLGAAVAASTLLEALSAHSLRQGGLFENPNMAAAVMMPILILIMLPSNQRLPSKLRLAISLLLLMGIVETMSRAAFLAVAVASVVWAAIKRGWPGKLALAICLAAVGLVLLRSATLHDRYQWKRIAIWESGLKTAAEKPILGVGPGGLEEALMSHQPRSPGKAATWSKIADNAESTPISLMAQCGALGTALFVLFAWHALSFTSKPLTAAMAAFSLFHDITNLQLLLVLWPLLLGGTKEEVEQNENSAATDANCSEPKIWVFMRAVTVFVLIFWAAGLPELERWSARTGKLSFLANRGLNRWAARRKLSQTLQDFKSSSAMDLEKAAEVLRLSQWVIESHPGSPKAWWDAARATSAVFKGRFPTKDIYQLARKRWMQTHALWPTNARILVEWALFERNVGELERADALVSKALNLEPNMVSGWLLSARLELDRGRVEQAKRRYYAAQTIKARYKPPSLPSYESWIVEAPKRWWLELERVLGPDESQIQ